EGSLTRNFIDTTFKALSLSDTSKYVQITIEGDADLGSGVHPKITILLNKVQFSNQAISGGSDELVEETIDFKAFFNETDSEIGTVTLVNLTSEYNTPVSD
nr:hypothetical protein [Bacteroidaceae bacterium]